MIQKFVDRFMEDKGTLVGLLRGTHPEDYKHLVKMVIYTITSATESYLEPEPDPDRIHEIDDGDYQGTLLFVIGAKGYQPSDYWYVKVNYGSCSGCDTLQLIRGYTDSLPTEDQIEDYMTLALHIVQGLRAMEDIDEALS